MLRCRLLLLLALAACRPAPGPPPRAEFIVASADSTFWVHSGPDGVHVRGVPLQLAYYGGRFYEVYVADDDRSYADALIVGQHVYRRDLITNDSALVFRDREIERLQRWYVHAYPGDRRLRPEEDVNANPLLDATSELRIAGQYGPYLSYIYEAGADLPDDADGWDVTRCGVLDLRSGRRASIADLFGRRVAASVLRQARVLFERFQDSVRASHDVRAIAATAALGDFHFDSTSFRLTDVGSAPAVAFVVPGRGRRAGGLTLALPPIVVAAPRWWSAVRATLPIASTDSSVIEWRQGRFRVLARYDRSVDAMRVSLADSVGERWPIGTLPPSAHHAFWLDAPDVDSITLHALDRAFNEAALYSDETRTAMTDPSTPGATPVSRPGRPVRESRHETSEIMMPQHANNMGHVFGGVILSMMDRTAAVAAIRHARQQCVTVSVDRVDFREPIHLGDLIIMKASVNYAGRTSMEVGVRVEAENLLDGVRRHTNSCYATFVAIDRNGRPVEVPAVIPESDAEQRRYAAAQERRRRRLEEREAEGR
jgi:acyl-CoA hydrolase